MKEAKIILLLFASILILSAFVYAVGSAGGGNTASSDSTTTNASRTQPAVAVKKVNCEVMPTMKARIACRLHNKGKVLQNDSAIHESCRNLNVTGKENCKRLYQDIKECYAKQGKEKDRCFKLKTGFATSAVSGQGINKPAAREYLVALLYELEERVEEKQAAGVITEQQATDIITKIAQIKEKILQNAPGSEIRPLIRELKQLWRAAFGPGNVPSQNNTGTNVTINNTGTNSTTNNTLNTTTNST